VQRAGGFKDRGIERRQETRSNGSITGGIRGLGFVLLVSAPATTQFFHDWTSDLGSAKSRRCHQWCGYEDGGECRKARSSFQEILLRVSAHSRASKPPGFTDMLTLHRTRAGTFREGISSQQGRNNRRRVRNRDSRLTCRRGYASARKGRLDGGYSYEREGPPNKRDTRLVELAARSPLRRTRAGIGDGDHQDSGVISDSGRTVEEGPFLKFSCLSRRGYRKGGACRGSKLSPAALAQA